MSVDIQLWSNDTESYDDFILNLMAQCILDRSLSRFITEKRAGLLLLQAEQDTDDPGFTRTYNQLQGAIAFCTQLLDAIEAKHERITSNV